MLCLKINKFTVLSVFLVLYLIFPREELFSETQSNPAVKEDIENANFWDFGKVKEGEVLRHEFTLKNDTPKVLNVQEVNTSCGCIASEIKKKSLLSGEETTIEVKFKSKGYSGLITQRVYVHTDDIDNEILEYIIKAEVIKK